ncbi:RNA-directed DNA polymerase [Priestia megaterium]|uniref:reverse transcriptase domain-containing protein n=1 Tax=Priestia megaterium TaxID=1404 RepID=UPI001B39FAA2|nr:reverse transcriptase domain-containing protein [Priestia megaterium]MBQ4870041.1 RNA-directed DNA polymerase [Priestia megaterium]
MTKLNNELIEELSRELFNTYFYNRRYYGRQVENDSGKVVYIRKRNKISATILKNMLESQKSIMSYQQVRQKLKWICLDIDISKEFINTDFDFFTNNEMQNKLFDVYERVIGILGKYGIKYTSEFSGNRGIHIWIFFNKEITKNIGYQIIRKIEQESAMETDQWGKEIVIDKYPKNGSAKTNTIGLGVKVPLSYHLRSNRYSYLINDKNEIKKIEILSDEFLREQLSIIKKIDTNNPDNVMKSLNIVEEISEEQFKRIEIQADQLIPLKSIIDVLSKSELFRKLFDKPVAHLNEKDRIVIVATLARLKTSHNENLGINLLKEFFSSDLETYDEDLTNEKIENLKNLYPPNIKYLEELYNLKCSYCEENNFVNVYDLIQSEIKVEIKPVEKNFDDLNKFIHAEINYLRQNDEVPLTFVRDELSYLETDSLEKKIENIYANEFDYNEIKAYKFIRNESKEKSRTLYSLGASDRVTSSYLASKMTEFMYGDFSINSYAYRLNKSNNNYIFENWSQAWLNYIYSIEGIINDGSYDDFYLIKLDIKSFYNSINHITLREVLLERIKLNFNEVKLNEIYPIISYLLQLTKQIMNSDIGLPQGPAYARILAEFYLGKVDFIVEEFIDDDFENYFRYVDDIFIILKNKERAEEIFDKVKTALDILGLELNSEKDKFQFGLIKDLKYQVISKSFEKYFVDGLDYEDASEELINNAKRLLNNLLLNEINEIEVKELPFYLTHLIDDEILESKREKIGELILKDDIGRGSLFKHFYNNILFAKNEISFELNLISNLKGLARSNLFSAVINNHKKVSNDIIHFIIQSYFNEDLLEYEEIELTRLILISKTSTSNLDFNSKRLGIILDNMKYLEDFYLSKENEEKILPQLQYRANLVGLEEKISELDTFLEKISGLHSIENVVKTFEAIINISMKRTFNKKAAQHLANIVSFISLYSDIKIDGFTDMWKKVISFEEKYQLNMSEWYKFKKHVNWSKVQQEQLVMFISDVLKGKAIDPLKPVSKTEKEYTSYLLFLMLQPQVGISQKIKDDVNFEKIKEIIYEQDIKFLKWCIDEETKYYPDLPEVARLNVFYNNRVILRKNNKLFIRADANLREFINSEDILTDNWLNGKEYINFILDIGASQLMNICDKLKGKHLIDAIIIVTKVMEKIDEGEIYNYFEKGTFVNDSEEIHFKYSKFDRQTIVDKTKQFKTDPYKMKLNLINLLENSDLIKVNEGFYYYNSKNFISEFIPSRCDGQELIEYIMELGKYLNKNLKANEINPFIIESAKLNAIKKLVKTKKINFKEIDFLNKYSTLSFESPERLIVFNNNGTEVNEDNLFELIDGILNKINFEEFKELNKFYNEMNKVKERAEKYLTKQHNKVIRLTRDNKSPEIKIDGRKFLLKDIQVLYPFEHEELEEVLPTDILDLSNRYALYIGNDSNVMIAVPLQGLISLKEKISLIINDDIVSKLKEERSSIKSLECYSQALEVVQKQNNIPVHEASQRLIQFITQFEKRYEESLLKLIAAYKVIDEHLCKEYFSDLKRIIDENQDISVLPLKPNKDDNGFHVMLTTVGRWCGFDRNSSYLNRLLNDYKAINDKSTSSKTLLIPIDIGLGGTQFRSAIMHYYKPTKTLEGFYNFEKEVFGQYLKSVDHIIIQTVFYTSQFEEKVHKNLDTIYSELETKKPLISIKGEKLNKADHVFYQKLEYIDRELIIQAFSEERFKNHRLYHKKGKFEELLQEIEVERTSNMLVARYKSMPKVHLIPLTGKNGVFNYRNDDKKS